MKKIGLIGGMSWESSLEYYRLLNEKVKNLLGGFHSAKCIMESVDFAEIEKLQHLEDWDTLNSLMAESAKALEKAGAKLIILCTNTMHLCSPAIKEAIDIPFLHIAEAAGEKIKQLNVQKVLLLGTRFTMEKDFYKNILQEEFNVAVIIPNEDDRQLVHDIIYKELVQGIINESSRNEYLRIINKSVAQGAQGVLLGCTEIPLLIKQEHCKIPVFDTTKIHAEAAVELALS